MASSGLHATPATMTTRTPTPLQSNASSRSDQASPKPSASSSHSRMDDIDAVIQMATASARTAGPPIPGKDTRTQLFVGNLPYRVRWQDLKDLFRKAGTVLRADVSLGPDNRSRGYGTVLLATAEDAGRAIDMFNGYSWQTRILEVRADRIPPEYDMTLPLPSPLHAGPFMQSATPMNQAFAASTSSLLYPSAQNVLDTSIDSIRSGTPLGSLSTSTSLASLLGSNILKPSSPPYRNAQAPAFTAPPPHSRAHSGLPSTLYNSTPSSGLGRSLFVGNLPFQCQWQDLKDLFRRAGSIVRADVSIGPDGRSRGYGTVLFATEVDADRAVAMFNGYEYQNRVLKVHHDKFTQIPSSSPPPTAGLVDMGSHMQAYHILRSLSANAVHTQSSGLSQQYTLHDLSTQSSSSAHSLASSLLRHSSQPTSPYDPIPPDLPPIEPHHAQSFDSVLQAAHVDAQLLRPSASAPANSTNHSQPLNPFEAILPPPPVLKSPPLRQGLRSKVSKESRENLPWDSAANSGSHFSSLDQLRPESDMNTTRQTALWPSSEMAVENVASEPSTPPHLADASKTTSPPSTGSAHPGPIQLPPQQFSMMSPLTRGLPPMTPSMPGFTFHPQTMTPPVYPHFLSPGLVPFSPTVPGQSPTAYYTANPFLNATPGAMHQSMHGMFPMHSPPAVTPIMTMTPGAPVTPGMPMTPGHPLSPGHFPPHMLHHRIPFHPSPGHAPTSLPSETEQHRTPESKVPGYVSQSPHSRGLGTDFAAATAMIAAASNAGIASHHHASQHASGTKPAEPTDYFPLVSSLSSSQAVQRSRSSPGRGSEAEPDETHGYQADMKQPRIESVVHSMFNNPERSRSQNSATTSTGGTSSKDTTPETDVTGTDIAGGGSDTTHSRQSLYGAPLDSPYIQEASLRLAMAGLSLGGGKEVPKVSKSHLGETASAPDSAQKRSFPTRTTSLEGFPGPVMGMTSITPASNQTASSASPHPRPRSGLLPPLELPRVDASGLESQFMGMTRQPAGMISPGTARRASFNDRPRKPSGLGIGMN